MVNTEGGRLHLSIRPDIEPGFRYPNDTYLEQQAEPLAPPPEGAAAGGAPPDGKMFRDVAGMTIARREAREGLLRAPKRRSGSPSTRPGPTRAAAARVRASIEAGQADRSAQVIRLFESVSAPSPDAGPSLACAGARVVAAVVSGGSVDPVSRPSVAGPGVILSLPADERRARSAGLRLEGGSWVFGTILERMRLVFAVSPAGASGAVLRQGGLPGQPYRSTEAVLAHLEAGALTGGHARDVAVALRHGKHQDPIRGVVAAYLYDRLGDIDSIRQLAWFYARQGQAIPFDIALLAQLPGEAAPNGFTIDLPAIGGRASASEDGGEGASLFQATSAIDGAYVGGRFPFLRQGWARLEQRLLPGHPALIDLGSGLAGAPFTTLNEPAGDQLAELISKGEV